MSDSHGRTNVRTQARLDAIVYAIVRSLHMPGNIFSQDGLFFQIASQGGDRSKVFFVVLETRFV